MRGLMLLACLCAVTAGPLPAAASESELATLERAVADYPDDAELRWALAMSLAEHGRVEEGIRELEHYASRWPDRRPDVALQLGRLLFEAERDEEALAELESAIEADPESGTAHLYRGLVLRRLGRAAEADRDFQAAAVLEPGLRATALLMRGLYRLELAQNDLARQLLMEAADLDTSGDIDVLVTQVLSGEPAAPEAARPFSLYASAGFEADSNATLESRKELFGATAEQRDSRLLWIGGLQWRALETRSAGVTLGYRYSESKHDDIESFDLASHLAMASAFWRASERTTLRADGFYSATIRDGDRYARSISGQPSVVLSLGPRAGLVRIWGEATRTGYLEDPIFSSLDRDGVTLGGGLMHIAHVPGLTRAWAAIGARFARTRTDASTDLLGFRGDYDSLLWEGSARFGAPLPWKVDASGALTVTRERYLNRNLIDSLTDEGIGTPFPERRRDTVIGLRLAVERPLTRWVGLEVAWRYTRQISNVDVYDYRRHVVGMYLRAEI